MLTNNDHRILQLTLEVNYYLLTTLTHLIVFTDVIDVNAHASPVNIFRVKSCGGLKINRFNPHKSGYYTSKNIIHV